MRMHAFPVAGVVRRARWMSNLTQRELARKIGVSPSTIGRVESGSLMPSIALLVQLIGVADLAVIVVDREGRVVHPMPADDLPVEVSVC